MEGELVLGVTYGVPNLQLENFVVYFEAVGAEFDAYGYLVLFLELIVHHSLHET